MSDNITHTITDIPCLTATACACVQQARLPAVVLQHVMGALMKRLADDPATLTTPSDPTYTTLSSVFNRIYTVLCYLQGEPAADAIVSAGQLSFLSAMLERANFNAMLAVLREANSLLERGRKLKRDLRCAR